MPWVLYHPFKKQIQQKKDQKNQQDLALALIKNLPQHATSLSIWEAVQSGDLQAVNYHLATADNAHQMSNLIDAEQGYTLLHSAIMGQENSIDTSRLLLFYGAEVDIYSGHHVLPIHTIPLYCPDPVEYLQLLIHYGANVNVADGDYWTPLHYVARFTKQPLEAMRLLVRHGAKVNAQDQNLKTPAFCLLANGDYAKELEWLITNGASPYINGLLLDSTTGIARSGSLVVQAAKYFRVTCMTWLLTQFRWSDNDIEHAIYTANTQLCRSGYQSINKDMQHRMPIDETETAASATIQALRHYLKSRELTSSAVDRKTLIARKISLKLLNRA
jgi:Ankyrin repeats (many copies)